MSSFAMPLGLVGIGVVGVESLVVRWTFALGLSGRR